MRPIMACGAKTPAHSVAPPPATTTGARTSAPSPAPQAMHSAAARRPQSRNPPAARFYFWVWAPGPASYDVAGCQQPGGITIGSSGAKAIPDKSVDFFRVDPAHQLAELAADDFDGVVLVFFLHSFEVFAAALGFRDPFF